jgi:hypothetical protein
MHATPFLFVQMDRELTKRERERVLGLLLEMRLASPPSSSIAEVFKNLVQFASDKGCRLYWADDLLKSWGCSGCFSRSLNAILLRRQAPHDVAVTLAHEVGHLIGCLTDKTEAGNRASDEAFADRLEKVILDIFYTQERRNF